MNLCMLCETAYLTQERPDAILPTMGGQTGLNLAKNMAESGMLDKYGVELIGAKLPSIDRAEDRELFKQAMKRIGLKTPPRWDDGLGFRVSDGLGVTPYAIAVLPPALCS